MEDDPINKEEFIDFLFMTVGEFRNKYASESSTMRMSLTRETRITSFLKEGEKEDNSYIIKDKELFDLFIKNSGQTPSATMYALMSQHSYEGHKEATFDVLSNRFKQLIQYLGKLFNNFKNKKLEEDTVKLYGLNDNCNKIKDINLRRFILENFRFDVVGDNVTINCIEDNNKPIFVKYIPLCGLFKIGSEKCKNDMLREEFCKAYEGSTLLSGGASYAGLDFVEFQRSLKHFIDIAIGITGSCDIDPNCDDFGDVYDLTTGSIYTRKGSELLNKDGTPVQNWLDDTRCYGIGDVTPDECETLAWSVLTGSINDVTKLADSGLLKKLTGSVSKMNPGTLEQILKTFGVQFESGPQGQIPTSLEYWGLNTLKTLVSADTQKIILENSDLLKFLKTVIEFVRQNPAILKINSTIDNSVNTQRTYSLVPQFVPVNQNNAAQCESVYTTALLNTPLIPTTTLMNPVMNTFPVPFSPFGNVGMRGGSLHGGDSNLEPTARLLNSMYSNILMRFERAGCALSQQDKDRIKCAIDKLNRLELNLQKVLQELHVYSEVEKSCTGAAVTLQNIEDRDITRLKQSVSEMSSLVSANLHKQHNIVDVMIREVLQRLTNFVRQ